MIKNLVILCCLIVFIGACKNPISSKKSDVIVDASDDNCTDETLALLRNLVKYQDSSIMFGHQDDLAYGIDWWAEDFRSDVFDVSGSYPAVYGWDLGKIGSERNLDSVSFLDMKRWMIRVFENGGINTISWHLDNPVTGGGSWDQTPAVAQILPGGDKHDYYKEQLNHVADFISSLKTNDGTLVPVIFRPFHELNGSWFWWGRDHCSTDEYISLYRFTVEYLRDEKGLHNILYSYSTDRFDTEEEYMERFPGEEYVDLLGYDDYHSFSVEESIPKGINSLEILVSIAQRMNKPAALTETGLESIPVEAWWTDHVLKPIMTSDHARKISYILVWRNSNLKHHYAPYPGHLSSGNFIEFEENEFTWFLTDLPDMYSTEN